MAEPGRALTLPLRRHLCFGRLTCSKYLLGATESGVLCCWNLLSCARKGSPGHSQGGHGREPGLPALLGLSGCDSLFPGPGGWGGRAAGPARIPGTGHERLWSQR